MFSGPVKRLMLQNGALLTLLGACANLTPTAAPETADTGAVTACAAFARVSFDRLADTPETIRQIKAYDAARDALCGKGR